MLAVIVAVCVVFIVRIQRLRATGVGAVLRSLPAEGHDGWRHGFVRYDDDALGFYSLRSLRPGPTRVMRRRSLDLVRRRPPQAGGETELTDGYGVIVVFTDRSARWELALDADSATAFQSWVEASPSERMRRSRRPGR